MLKILYLGVNSGTSALRARALVRLGHHCHIVDPYEVFAKNRLLGSWIFKTGALGFAQAISNYVLKNIENMNFDIALIDNGELISGALVRKLRHHTPVIVNFNQDNPYVQRDGLRWRLLWQALRYYDLVVTPRQSGLQYADRFHLKRMLVVPMCADEVVHRPYEGPPEALSPFLSDVVFVGTWMPERGPFLLRLLEAGVPLRIFGPRWSKAPEYSRLKHHIVDRALSSEDYVKAISASKIALALLSKGNEDMHTTRSFEIPAIGRLLCGERTAEHTAFFEEGKEAVFWDDADECAAQCLSLLRSPERITTIAAAGMKRVHANGNFNEPSMAKIIATALDLKGSLI